MCLGAYVKDIHEATRDFGTWGNAKCPVWIAQMTSSNHQVAHYVTRVAMFSGVHKTACMVWT